ncbi:hypothetical protein PIB30_069029 [Stylosanthes scabra]|uniref:Uncharacterized protein n=1 Tax=Stylosanthes scabra TaxID=79078 RepID=A0ABU6RN86_9FABA|nr:hypothetical protein [Stylosanthes scabra]
MVTIAQGLASKGNLAHPSTIYKLCKDAGVLLREFIRTSRILALSYITAKRMQTIRFPRNQPQQQQEDEEEDEPMPQGDGGNFEGEDQQPPQQDQQPQQHGFPNFQPRYESQYHEDLQGIEETLSKIGRPLFHGFLKSDYGASSSSQVDLEEPVPLRTAPPSPHFRPPYPPPNSL